MRNAPGGGERTRAKERWRKKEMEEANQELDIDEEKRKMERNRRPEVRR